jgi:hypothetical protein
MGDLLQVGTLELQQLNGADPGADPKAIETTREKATYENHH